MLYDKDIREPLSEYLEEVHGKVRIIEEKQMGKSRADMVMVLPNKLVGIEIKSDADSYTRLSRQVKDYDKFYDENYVVVGSSHATHVSEHVPEYWGILSVEIVDETVDFYLIREAKDNPKMNPKAKLRILWRPELAHIQEINGMFKYKEKSKDFVRTKILEKISNEILQKQISDELFERDYNVIAETIQQFRDTSKRRVRTSTTGRKKRRKRRL